MENRVKHIKRALKATKRGGEEDEKRQQAKTKTESESEIIIEWKRNKRKIFKEETNHVKPYSRESVQILLLGGQIKE